MPSNFSNITVIKRNGDKENFDTQKVAKSLLRLGANPNEVKQVLIKLRPKLTPEIKSSDLYRNIKLILESVTQDKVRSKALSNKYSLKQAIMRLGPTGFPFEKFFAAILAEEGYQVETNKIFQGECLPHELDVIAKKDNKVAIIECKFHKKNGYKSGVKDVLYTYARYLDIQAKVPDLNASSWLVTNTKVSQDVITYGKCKGMTIISWDYPHKGSLRERVEKMDVLPITILKGLDEYYKGVLLKNDIIFCKDMPKARSLIKDTKTFNRLLEDAHAVCALHNH